MSHRFNLHKQVRTIKRVLITQRGFVQIVLQAPAVMAERMWIDHG